MKLNFPHIVFFPQHFLTVSHKPSNLLTPSINKRIKIQIIIIKQMNFEQKEHDKNSDFEYKQAGSIKKNDFCMLSDHPCKIMEYAISKPGKHGSAKICFTGIDIFTGKRVETVQGTSDHVVVPIVKKVELEVADIS